MYQGGAVMLNDAAAAGGHFHAVHLTQSIGSA